MAVEVLFPRRWKEMPDPRPRVGDDSKTVIEVREPEWRKIVQKHFANSKEPWAAALTQLALKHSSSDEENAAVTAALADLRNECVSTLRKPLVILYACKGGMIQGQGYRWLLMLPCGALAVIWCEKQMHRLKTCYFTGAVDVKPRETRWRYALRQQVQEYSVFDERSRRFLYPEMSHLRKVDVVGGTSEYRYFFHFVAADAWGFLSSQPGAEWRSPDWNWASGEIRLSR